MVVSTIVLLQSTHRR